MFEGLSSEDLRHVAHVLVERRLAPPYSEFGLKRAGVFGETLCADLAGLDAEGFTPVQVARLAEECAAERDQMERTASQLELVVSGPDAQARARDTSVVIEQLFGEAEQSVVVVGFAIYNGREIFGTLAERMDKDSKLRAVCCFDVARNVGDAREDADIIEGFARRFVKYEWPGTRLPLVYYDPRSLGRDRETRAVLHAKTIVIDGRKAILTSANPTPAAYLRNIELGIVLTGGSIPKAIESYFLRLISEGRLIQLPL
jgi:phosphatidylserine/phosphatidylglycerophosphate/cardiolipin synthase-like enzyme